MKVVLARDTAFTGPRGGERIEKAGAGVDLPVLEAREMIHRGTARAADADPLTPTASAPVAQKEG